MTTSARYQWQWSWWWSLKHARWFSLIERRTIDHHIFQRINIFPGNHLPELKVIMKTPIMKKTVSIMIIKSGNTNNQHCHHHFDMLTNTSIPVGSSWWCRFFVWRHHPQTEIIINWRGRCSVALVNSHIKQDMCDWTEIETSTLNQCTMNLGIKTRKKW